MVGGSRDQNVARKRVYLKEKRADNTLYLARVMRVTPLLSESIELIKEQHTLMSSHKIKQLAQAAAGFAEKTTNYCLISNHE